MSIGENIKALRKRAGLTQGQLSEKSGMQLTQISRIENDDTDPKVSTILKLIKALNCTADDVFIEEKEQITEKSYIKRTLSKIEKLTPLRRYVALDMISCYCDNNTIQSSSLYEMSNGEINDGEDEEGYHSHMMYLKEMDDDGLIIQSISHEMYEEGNR